jgi:hypothetical protein
MEKTTSREILLFVRFTKFYSSNKIKNNEISRPCNSCEREERCVQSFGGETYRRETLGRREHTREDNIKMFILEVDWGIDWIELAKDRGT